MLSMDYPKRNPNGMMVFHANDMKVDKELIDCITIYKPLFNARDIKKTKAMLHEDGGGILVTEPSVPTYMIKKVKEIHSVE
jgi:hypothetical protein